MAYFGRYFLRLISSIGFFITLSIGALAMAVFPPASFAADPAASLALDRVGHAAQISGETVRTNQPFIAFGISALLHDRYSAGGFALDRVDARS